MLLGKSPSLSIKPLTCGVMHGAGDNESDESDHTAVIEVDDEERCLSYSEKCGCSRQ